MLNPPHPLNKEKLEKLATHRLLSVLKVARKAGNVLYRYGIPSWELGAMTEEQWNKEKQDIDQYIVEIKAELAKREHVDG